MFWEFLIGWDKGPIPQVEKDVNRSATKPKRRKRRVNLQTRRVQVFDHSADGQLLYFKERFVAADHPDLASWPKTTTSWPGTRRVRPRMVLMAVE